MQQYQILPKVELPLREAKEDEKSQPVMNETRSTN